MHLEKNTHRHEDSGLEKNNLITQEADFSQKCQKKAIWIVVKLVHATEVTLSVSTLNRWDRALTGPVLPANSPSANDQKTSSGPTFLLSSTFCSSHSYIGIELGSVSYFMWVGKRLHLWFSWKKFCSPLKILWEESLVTFIEYYLLWWDLNFFSTGISLSLFPGNRSCISYLATPQRGIWVRNHHHYLTALEIYQNLN